MKKETNEIKVAYQAPEVREYAVKVNKSLLQASVPGGNGIRIDEDEEDY